MFYQTVDSSEEPNHKHEEPYEGNLVYNMGALGKDWQKGYCGEKNYTAVGDPKPV